MRPWSVDFWLVVVVALVINPLVLVLTILAVVLTIVMKPLVVFTISYIRVMLEVVKQKCDTMVMKHEKRRANGMR